MSSSETWNKWQLMHGSFAKPRVFLCRPQYCYFGEDPTIREVPSNDLRRCSPVSMRLINEIIRWLSAPNLREAGIPPTTWEGLCIICPLNNSCESLFGRRKERLVTQLRHRIGDLGDNATGEDDKGILLGATLDQGQDSVYWNPFGGHPRLPNGHLLVVGTSGSGKTQVMKSVIAEIVEKQVVPLIFDFNNDYVVEGFPERHRLRVYEPGDGMPLNPLELVPDPLTGKIQVANGIFSTAEILKRIYRLGVQQEANLRTAMKELYKDHGFFPDTSQAPPSGYPPFEDLEIKIRELPNHVPLLNRLSPIFSLNLFTTSGDGEDFAEFIRLPTVVRLAPLPTEEVKLAVVEFVLLRLYPSLHGTASQHFTAHGNHNRRSAQGQRVRLFGYTISRNQEIRRCGDPVLSESQGLSSGHSRQRCLGSLSQEFGDYRQEIYCRSVEGVKSR